MIAQFACWLALSISQQGTQFYTKTDLAMQPNSPTQLWLNDFKEPIDPPQLSPKKFGEEKQQWMFPWLAAGYAKISGDPSLDQIRFRVFSQEQRGNYGARVARMLLRLWDFNVKRLKLIHNPRYHKGIVDVYLCFGGKAGGEQLFDVEYLPDPKNPAKKNPYDANTIYIYDTSSFTDPIEMAREVAHEYGHATWPPIGLFKEPEEWADGYLAERIYLRWLRDALASKEVTPDDCMGATMAGLDKWIATNVDPLIAKAATTLPTEGLLSDKSASGMSAFIGLAVYTEFLYPNSVFARSIKLTGSIEAKDYPQAVVLAAEEPDKVTLKIPATLSGKAIWIPLGTGKLSGAAVLKKDPSGWVQIQVGSTPVTVTNTH